MDAALNGGDLVENAKDARQTVRVAMCQTLCLDGDRKGNFRRLEYAMEAARKGKAQIACFPESSILGWENPEAHVKASPIPGTDTDRIGELARKFDMMIAIGLDEKDGDGLYDSAILVDRTGAVLMKHRKINVLPELMTPPYSTGKPEDIRAVDTELGRIGLLICADTFTDDHLQRMVEQKPALLLVPYGWAATNDKWPDHGQNLINLVSKVAKTVGCPTIGCDLVGQMTHGPWAGHTFGGQSVAASSTGRILAVAKDRDVDVVVVKVNTGKRSAA
jgi:predicted amidohydrolase